MENQSKIESIAENSDDLSLNDQCFIITPIGDINSDIYVKAMGLIDAVIRPVLKEFKFNAVAANHISSPGSINKQLLKAILEDKLVIANLTGLNPNVMYELAVRHAARLPIVIMAETGTRLPFDITDQRTIFYNDTLAGLNDAKSQLRLMVEKALTDKEPDNPIYQAAEQSSILKQLPANDPFKLILERLDRIENSRADITHRPKSIELIISGHTLDSEFQNEDSLINYINTLISNKLGVKLLVGEVNGNKFLYRILAESKQLAKSFVNQLQFDSLLEVEFYQIPGIVPGFLEDL
jgi:hypothetical protein